MVIESGGGPEIPRVQIVLTDILHPRLHPHPHRLRLTLSYLRDTSAATIRCDCYSMDNLSPDQAQALWDAGGFLVLTDLPPGSEFGIDGT